MKFEKGYSFSRKKAKKGIKYIRSCFNCDYFYKAIGDSDEMCQNPNVLEYDLVVDNNNIYCTYWCLVRENDNTTFSRIGERNE